MRTYEMDDFACRLSALRGRQIEELQKRRDEQVAERQAAEKLKQINLERGRTEWRKCTELEDVLRLMDIDKYILADGDQPVTMYTGWVSQDTSAALFVRLHSYRWFHIRILWSCQEEKYRIAGDWVDYLSRINWNRSNPTPWRLEGVDAVEVAEILIETLAPVIDAEKCILR